MRVTVVEEQEVFLNANGGHGHCTAFWVVYISNQEKNYATPFKLYSLHEASYEHFIPSHLKQDVDLENTKLVDQILDHKDGQVCTQINEKYLEYFNELTALYRQNPGKSISDNFSKCSFYTGMWSEQKHDLCKRMMLHKAFNEIGHKLQLDQASVLRVWHKLKTDYGSRDTYPKPYLALVQLDWQQAQLSNQSSKPSIFYLAAQNIVFQLILSENYPSAVALIEQIF